MATNGACTNGVPIYEDHNGAKQVPMYYTATEFADHGGSYIYMDHSTSGSTDQYAKDIVSVINEHPNQSIYLVGHSAGANAIVAGLSILLGEDGKGDLSRIAAVAMLDPFLTAGNGDGTLWPENWPALSNLGNQDNADALVAAGVPFWVGNSSGDLEPKSFPRSFQPRSDAVPYFSNDNHFQLAVDIDALKLIIQFFANPSSHQTTP